MKRKLIGYIGVAIIGIGFILMAATDTLHSEAASVIQAALGFVFIVAGAVKCYRQIKEKKS